MAPSRPTLLFLAGLALALPTGAEAPTPGLAAALADQIVRVAKTRSVDLGPIEDHTGRGAAFALDLRALVLHRLAGRVRLAEAGLRLRIESVLTETPQRLIVSARVVAEPGGSLVDLLTASVTTDPALLPLSPAPTRAAPSSIDVLTSAQSTPLEGPVLDLALLAGDRILVLGVDSLALYHLEGAALAQEGRRALPEPLETVRSPGGLLVPAEDAVWAMSSRTRGAILYALGDAGHMLAERLQSAALPVSGSPDGLRYRPGTNLLEGALPGLGGGPFLAFEASGRQVAVDADGLLCLASSEGGHHSGLRAGPALAPLWPGVLAAASAAPPGLSDSILVLASDGTDLKILDTLSVAGAVRALAASARGTSARLVAAAEEDGRTRLLVLELRRAEP